MAALWIIGILCLVIFVGAFIQGWNKPANQKNTIAPTSSHAPKRTSALQQNKPGCTTVNIDDFFEKHSCSIPEELWWKMSEADKYYSIDNKMLAQIEAKTNARKIEERRLQICCEMNNNGIAFEKAGQIDAAIEVYEENIKGGYRALHSYNRLMILYRKRKDYDNEIRVIDYSIEVFSGDDRFNGEIDKWLERRIKAEQLKKKQTKTEL